MHVISTLPDATHVKRSQARDIAEGLVKLFALRRAGCSERA